MKRFHLLEISDQNWCPNPLRDGATLFLQYFENVSNVFTATTSLIRRAMEQCGTRRVIDLCSGSGGPWLRLHRLFHERERFPIKIWLTDKHPHVESLRDSRAVSFNGLNFYPASIDATNVPDELTGFRTFFNSFHHFTPDEAIAILQDTVAKRQGIGIFEATDRNIMAILQIILLIPVSVIVLMPFVRPFRFSLLFWTYIIPLLPFLITYDGVISSLRTYTPDELRDLTEKVTHDRYVWQTGRQSVQRLPRSVTYLIGYPLKADENPPPCRSGR
jgi:hypothetical protein